MSADSKLRPLLRRIFRFAGKTYVLVATVVLSLELLLVAWFVYTSGWTWRPQPRPVDENPVGAQTTEVVLVGTIHGQHARNPLYSPEALRDIITAANPDLILSELPRTTDWQLTVDLARLWPRAAYRTEYPELWSAASAANDLGVPLMVFDWSQRENMYRSKRYRMAHRQASRGLRTWGSQNDNPEDRRKLVDLMHSMQEGEFATSRDQSPRMVNSAIRDTFSRFRYALMHEIIPDQMAIDPEFKETAEALRWCGDVWQRRNQAMVDNILSIIAEADVRRVIVSTGASHRYILRDLLKTCPEVELKEYWQLK